MCKEVNDAEKEEKSDEVLNSQSQDEPTSSEVRTSKTAVLACRMPQDEIKAVERAAAAIGESTSEYVRKAILLRRVGNQPVAASMSVSIGSPNFQGVTIGSSTRPSLILAPDSYPHTYQVEQQ